MRFLWHTPQICSICYTLFIFMTTLCSLRPFQESSSWLTAYVDQMGIAYYLQLHSEKFKMVENAFSITVDKRLCFWTEDQLN